MQRLLSCQSVEVGGASVFLSSPGHWITAVCLFSDKKEALCVGRLYLFYTFTDNICASSVLNLAHTRQSEAPKAIHKASIVSWCSQSCRTQVCKRNALQFSYYCAIISLRIGSGVLQGHLVYIWAEEQRAFHDTDTLQISIEFAIQSHEAEDPAGAGLSD